MLDKLLKIIKTNLKSNGFSLTLSPTKEVLADGLGCSGYFCDTTKVLVVATKKSKKDWIATLLHEYCHFLQFIEECPFYAEYTSSNPQITYDYLDDSYRGLTQTEYEALVVSIEATQRVELDCERRVIALIKEHKLQRYINIKEYSQKATAYVLFYQIMLAERRWYTLEKAPYAYKPAYSQMPTTLDGLSIRNDHLIGLLKAAGV
jgi:hypothetical protein